MLLPMSLLHFLFILPPLAVAAVAGYFVAVHNKWVTSKAGYWKSVLVWCLIVLGLALIEYRVTFSFFFANPG